MTLRLVLVALGVSAASIAPSANRGTGQPDGRGATAQCLASADAAATGQAATLAQLEWLSGVWTGVRRTTTIEERWTPADGGAMLATSRSLRDGRLIAYEFLCIASRGSTLVYVAMPNGRAPGTEFTLTAIDAASATFENPAHDFPKRIRYTRRGDDGLDATISGSADQPTITFQFTKQ